MTATAEHVAWCRNLFSSLVDDGVWAVPRSGVTFRKRGDVLVLDPDLTMPYLPEMEGTLTPEEFREQQDGEFETVREHFGAAGIEVTR